MKTYDGIKINIMVSEMAVDNDTYQTLYNSAFSLLEKTFPGADISISRPDSANGDAIYITPDDKLQEIENELDYIKDDLWN